MVSCVEVNLEDSKEGWYRIAPNSFSNETTTEDVFYKEGTTYDAPTKADEHDGKNRHQRRKDAKLKRKNNGLQKKSRLGKRRTEEYGNS